MLYTIAKYDSVVSKSISGTVETKDTLLFGSQDTNRYHVCNLQICTLLFKILYRRATIKHLRDRKQIYTPMNVQVNVTTQ